MNVDHLPAANLVTMAMNGSVEEESASWLNLQAPPVAGIDLVDGPRQVTGRTARDEEWERLWSLRLVPADRVAGASPRWGPAM